VYLPLPALCHVPDFITWLPPLRYPVKLPSAPKITCALLP